MYHCNMSTLVKLVSSGNASLYLTIGYRDNFNIIEMLNTLNSVDTDVLMYRPENLREANKHKQVLIKQLEVQWEGMIEVVPQIIHPDSSFYEQDVVINNRDLLERGLKPVLSDGEYSFLYLSPRSNLDSFVKAFLSSNEGKGINETFLIPTFTVQNRLDGKNKPKCVCVWGSDLKGMAFVVDKKVNNESGVLQSIKTALLTGNLLMKNDDINKQFKLYFMNNVLKGI